MQPIALALVGVLSGQDELASHQAGHRSFARSRYGGLRWDETCPAIWMLGV